jgi:hypothetical protein
MAVAPSAGGTGSKLTKAVVIIAGVASLIASLLSLVYGQLHLLPFMTYEANIVFAPSNRSIWLQTYDPNFLSRSLNSALTASLEKIIGSLCCNDMLFAYY